VCLSNVWCVGGDLKWVGSTIGDVTDFGNDWCVRVMFGVWVEILSGWGLRWAMSRISVMIGA